MTESIRRTRQRVRPMSYDLSFVNITIICNLYCWREAMRPSSKWVPAKKVEVSSSSSSSSSSSLIDSKSSLFSSFLTGFFIITFIANQGRLVCSPRTKAKVSKIGREYVSVHAMMHVKGPCAISV